MNKKAVIYARVGTQAQKDSFNSIVNQIQEMRCLAKAKGYEITNEFSDVGSEGSIHLRGFQNMLKVVRSNQIKAIFVRSVDRLTRDYQTELLVENIIKKTGTVIITSDLTWDSNPKNQMMWDFQVYLAKTYKRIHSERTKKGILLAKSKKVGLLKSISTDK